MLFHCMTRHGFASASVVRTGDLVDIDVQCQGSRVALPGVRFMIRFHAPRVNRIDRNTSEKHFALLGLSQFNFTKNPKPCTSTQYSFDDLVIDDSLILSEAV